MRDWGSAGRGPYRKGAKPPPLRRVLEDCDDGDLVEFLEGPPFANGGAGAVRAPSSFGRVSGRMNGGMFVRFQLPDGGESEPMHVADRAVIRRVDGYR